MSVTSLRTANQARGEVGLTLDGQTYPMSPSFETLCRIEARLGSVAALAHRTTNPATLLTLHELSVIAGEAIRRWGEEHDDKMVMQYSDEKLARLIAEDDLIACSGEIGALLVQMCRRKKRVKPDQASSPT